VNPCDEFVVKTLRYLGNDLKDRNSTIFASTWRLATIAELI